MNYKATFLLGLPDSQMIKVGGVAANGELLYQLEGNSEFHNFVKIPNENKHNLILVWNSKPIQNIPECDIVINCITDPDTNFKSLKMAANITEFLKKSHKNIAIFNDPTKIFATTRDKIYQKFNDLPKIYVPKVVRFNPKSVKDVFKCAKENNLKSFLIRPCGSHESQNLNLIRGEKDAALLDQYALNGSEHYITEFVNYKSPDGLYRKARLLIIGGKIVPRHFMTGESWMVYGSLHEKYMAHRPETIANEKYFISNFQKLIDPDALKSLVKIYRSLGLDYLGFDFAIRHDGSLVIFEINPAQNPFIQLDKKHFPYMPVVRENIISVLNAHVEERVKKLKSNI